MIILVANVKKHADQGSYEVVELTSSSSFTGSAAFTGVKF